MGGTKAEDGASGPTGAKAALPKEGCFCSRHRYCTPRMDERSEEPKCDRTRFESPDKTGPGSTSWACIRPISLLRFPLRFVDSNFPGDSPWA